MTGFSKGQKFSSNQMVIEESQSPWIFSGKGKSLGKKPTAASIR